MTQTNSPSLPVVNGVGSLLEIDWFDSTKEKLSEEAVLKGLLDYGLFAEKIPPCFISTGLTDFVATSMDKLLDEASDDTLRKALDKRAHDYVRYEALRDSNVPRHMGIPHPEAYAVQALAIAKHWKAIAAHCNKPNPIFSRIYVRHVKDGRIFEMNYKGVDRFQLEEDEQKWMTGSLYVVSADIASCFPSIYTHSIPWALHGKSVSKGSSSVNTLAGNLLDKCTQNTRDRQTNGLLIGPHSSNIISEIILTQIDIDLQAKGYSKLKRHVDDYRFYASTYDEAEKFIKDLGLSLRAYEMSLNEKKTKIQALPCPSEENWILEINRYPFLEDKELTFPEIRSFLDLALTSAQAIGKSTPLNYAIKVLARTRIKSDDSTSEDFMPRKLSLRGKRMYTQETINLALRYPYLAPLLEKYVFIPYSHPQLKDQISEFSKELLLLGLRKLYPDAIAHAIFLSIKYNLLIGLSDEQLCEIILLDDCICMVLLLEYAKINSKTKIKSAITKRADELKTADMRDKDKHWLLIYQVWTVKQLTGNGQGFLAELKKKDFKFFALPS